MARPRNDGRASRPPQRVKITEALVRRRRAEAEAHNIWDTHQRGLVLRVQPSGHRAWKAVYSIHGRARWYHIGDARAVCLKAARAIAAEIMVAAARGQDPAA